MSQPPHILYDREVRALQVRRNMDESSLGVS